MKFTIKDLSASGDSWLTENGVTLEQQNAMMFDTEQEAKDYCKIADPEENWSFVDCFIPEGHYCVRYKGNARNFHGFYSIVKADNKREAVEKVYAEQCDSSYFPQEDGTILDSAGNLVAKPFDDTIEYDGGSFYVSED